MDVTLSGGECGGEIHHVDAEPQVGDTLSVDHAAETLVYRYIGGGQAVFAGIQQP